MSAPAGFLSAAVDTGNLDASAGNADREVVTAVGAAMPSPQRPEASGHDTLRRMKIVACGLSLYRAIRS
jgi:hypothetical protein